MSWRTREAAEGGAHPLTYAELGEAMKPQEILRRVTEIKLDIENHARGAPAWTVAAYLATMVEQEVVSILYEYGKLEDSAGAGKHSVHPSIELTSVLSRQDLDGL